jgi:hypothetical protein
MDPEREHLIRRYAALDISWRELQERGFDTYDQVLMGLGELGLKYPVAPMTGPNVEARLRGIAMLEEAIERDKNG